LGKVLENLSPSNLYIRLILLSFGKNEKEKNPDDATSEN
jgi:hypothetical protein